MQLTPMVSRLSSSDRGDELSSEDKSLFFGIVGILHNLACWTRLDIAFAVSDRSRFVSNPSSVHMQATERRRISDSNVLDRSLNQLWAYVDFDWAGCVDT
jgi:hypothetical protein